MTLLLTAESVETPLGGLVLVADSEGALRAAEWVDGLGRLPRLLARQYGAHGYLMAEGRVADTLRHGIESYFRGEMGALDALQVHTGGTAFQENVWQALRQIRPGHTLSYRALGEALGLQDHARAVGHANAANPINIVIPCHRLVGTNGTLTGYAGGLERKRWLLAHEAAALAGLS